MIVYLHLSPVEAPRVWHELSQRRIWNQLTVVSAHLGDNASDWKGIWNGRLQTPWAVPVKAPPMRLAWRKHAAGLSHSSSFTSECQAAKVSVWVRALEGERRTWEQRTPGRWPDPNLVPWARALLLVLLSVGGTLLLGLSKLVSVSRPLQGFTSHMYFILKRALRILTQNLSTFYLFSETYILKSPYSKQVKWATSIF